MRLLHTADWHVGKTIRGNPRTDEHRAVLTEITAIAAEEAVDLVIVAGDLFETASPTGEHEQIVYDALLGLARTGAEVVVLAGNHDNAHRLAAVTPVFAHAEVHVVATPQRPDDGGVIDLTARSDGAAVRVAALPFVSKRGVVKADELMAMATFETQQHYAERLARVVDALLGDLPADAVNLATVHAFLAGGVMGGGERSAHTLLDYAVPPSCFPAGLHYVAAGHLHRHQEIGAACPARYSGSPLQLDFGETADTKGVVLVDAVPGAPAEATFRPLTAGRRLVTVDGDLDRLRVVAETVDPDAWVRVRVDEAPRTGLADDVRALLPNAVDVQTTRHRDTDRRDRPSRAGKGPTELFADYLADAGVDDPPLRALFDTIHDELVEDGAHR